MPRSRRESPRVWAACVTGCAGEVIGSEPQKDVQGSVCLTEGWDLSESSEGPSRRMGEKDDSGGCVGVTGEGKLEQGDSSRPK